MATTEPGLDAWRKRVADDKRAIHSTLIAVCSNEPYKDDPRWTQWTRFGRSACERLDMLADDMLAALAAANDERNRAAEDNERLQRELDHVRGLTQEEIIDEAHGALLTAANERAEAAEAKAEAVERVRAETLAEVDAAIRNANPEEGKYAPEWHRALRWALGRIRALGGPDA